jgi:hypothetical protein
MSRPRYPSDERTRQGKVERRAREGQEPRPSGYQRRLLPDPEDFAHPESCVRAAP